MTGQGMGGNASLSTVSTIFFVLALGTFTLGTAEFAAMSLVPMIARGFGISEPQAGHIIVAYAAGVSVGAPLFALFGARFSRKHLLVGMMLFYALGNALSALCSGADWLLVCRFVTGLPHGAYFGVAGLVASCLVPPKRRSRAVSRVILGLTIATIAGVPAADIIGQTLGWRWTFAVIALLSLITAGLVGWFAPRDRPRVGASIGNELRALRMVQVWLTLGVGVIGFGGIFCVYTYLASIMDHVTHVPAGYVPPMFALFGLGMTAGTLVCGWLADRWMMPTMGGVLIVGAVAMAFFPMAAHAFLPLAIVVFMIGASGGLSTVVQSRLLEVADGAEGLVAAFNQSAFNTANAIGPYLGGLAISAGAGWTSVGWVGLVLTLGGGVFFLISLLVQTRQAGSSQS
ncbi:MFS transporter [Asaia bogorensis]|uniref:MFS transporter n=1 Tax=Asaia bogorensis NBRC 16594 TaxID=1231624 RepID=A0AAN4R5D1_9PROT|nr:MFS transporter [Asaia bogorensis]GBQ76840.1 major facilitator superfamily arabinose transmembrane efflux protein [Asaia bogorensis NBRC 16594]GEL54710.1 MFS transporter [Asaia bogorensis NBRC 16594]